MSYRVDGHNAVGPKTVANLDELRQVPTQGAGDVYSGQMVMVSEIDYAGLVGASTGLDNSLLDDTDTPHWTGPSDGYIELSNKQREYLHSNFPVANQSLVDDSTNGTTISLWFNAYDKPTTSKHQTLFHCPTLSATQNSISNEFVPSLSLKGVSLHLAKHPGTGKPAIFYTLSATAKYTGSGVSGPLFIDYNGWVEDEIDIHEWHHLVFVLDSYHREVRVFINGEQRLSKPLISNIPNHQDYSYMYVNGENHVTEHDIFIGASLDSSGDMVSHFNGKVDGFSFIKNTLSSFQIDAIYNNGVINPAFAISSSYSGIHWPMGDFATDFSATNLIIENSWESGGYPSIAGVNCTSILNLKNKDMDKQYNVVRMQKDYADLSKGYSWHKSFAPSDDIISRRSVSFKSEASDSFSYLAGPDLRLSNEWDTLNNLTQGTLSITFFPDSSLMTEPLPGESSTYSLFSIGYSAGDEAYKNGLHVYVTKNSFLNDWTVVVIFVDQATGTEIPFYGQGNLSMDSWNSVVFSWDLGVESGDIAATLYLNKITLVTKRLGTEISADATKLRLPDDTGCQMLVGVNMYRDTSGVSTYLNPWAGKVDDIILSAAGSPSNHEDNVNLKSNTTVRQSAITHYTFGDHPGDAVSATDYDVWSEKNRIQNVLDPGIPYKQKIDLIRMFVGQAEYSILLFEDGFSGSSIPVPRTVPANWGTYYWDAEHQGWNSAYPNDVNYGFILVRPSDVDEDSKGRWVSIVSYTAWTAYLFGQSDSLSIESGFRDNVNEGDVAVFTESGKVVPQTAIEQWVNPNLFPNNRPSPNSSGYKGQRCYDGYYMYECVATDTWIRYLTDAFW